MAERSYTEAQLRTIKRKIRLVRMTVVVVLLLAVLAAIFYKGYKSAREKYEAIILELQEENKRLSDPVVQYEVAEKEINLALINTEIQDIGELATVEYLYTDAGKFESPAELFGKEISLPFTTKSFIVKWDGVIKAGVEVDKVKAEVEKERKEIVVYMPKARILSHEINSDSIETLDEKNGLFNPIKVEDIRTFDAVTKEAMEKRVIENGFLDKAFENAKGIISRIISTDLVEELDYSIVFQVIEE